MCVCVCVCESGGVACMHVCVRVGESLCVAGGGGE